MPSYLKNTVETLAQEIGFDLVGVAPAQPPAEIRFFENWLNAGYHASMDYLSRRSEERFHPEKLLPGVQSIIVVGLFYNTSRTKSIDPETDETVWISRYAWGEDYHAIIEEMLDRFVVLLQQKLGRSFQFKRYVDSGPVLEKLYAYSAGLGWFGKNSCLINRKGGSYFFLGEILTDLAIEPDSPQPDFCGDCTKCVDACPTGAIVAPKIVDSGKCLSYQTIENRKEVPVFIRGKMGRNVFGCDICQEVCPWNRRAQLSPKPEFTARELFFRPEASDFLKTVQGEYPAAFKNSPLKRAKQKGLLRNLLIVAGNNGWRHVLNQVDLTGHEELVDVYQWALAASEADEPA